MKRLMIVFVFATMLTGCSFKNKYTDYEHYDLTNYSHEVYTYRRNPDGNWNDLQDESYVVSLLVTKDKESDVLGYEEGIFYEVGENDYILLDSFSGEGGQYASSEYTYLYKDKLYILRRTAVYEYTLNRENTTKKEFEFDYSDLSKKYYNKEKNIGGIEFMEIDLVDDDYIYFKDVSIHNLHGTGKNLKCSLSNYICEEYKK